MPCKIRSRAAVFMACLALKTHQNGRMIFFRQWFIAHFFKQLIVNFHLLGSNSNNCLLQYFVYFLCQQHINQLPQIMYLLLTRRFSSLRCKSPYQIISILFRPFGFLAPKDFYIIWLLNILVLSLADEGYFIKFDIHTMMDQFSIWIWYNWWVFFVA